MRSYSRDGYVFDVRDEGPETGEVVLLLHGFPQDSTAWDGIVGPLHEAGYRTVAPDQRGYSSGAMPTGKKNYKMSELVQDATALLDDVGVDQAHVVGHDWGGMVAWSLASAAPDRCRTLSVLSTPHPGAFKSVMLNSTQMLKSWYMAMFQVPRVSEAILRPGGPAWRAMTKGLPEHQIQHYTQRMSRPGALSAALRWYRALPGDMLRPSTPTGRTRVPTLYVWGENDPALGRAAAEATGDFVAADYAFVALADKGHWLPETAADEISELLLTRWDAER